MSTKAMMAALKGKVLNDLGVAHSEALRLAPKTQVVADTVSDVSAPATCVYRS